MELDPVLLLNAVVSGLLLGGLYAAAAGGLAISFGMLDMVNIAHPALMVAGAFAVVALTQATGLDPLLLALLLMAPFHLLGALFFGAYHRFFERRGDEGIQGLAFFFGVMFILEVGMAMQFGPEQRFVEPAYAATTWTLGPLELPLRMLLPAVLSITVLGVLGFWLHRSFTGRAILAVAQDREALRLLAIDPVRIRLTAFGLSVALAGLAGGALVVVQAVDPWSGEVFIGRVFAIVILGGMASLGGTVLAALIFGVIENLSATLFGPSWSPAIAFGLLLAVLALRPQGLFGRAA